MTNPFIQKMTSSRAPTLFMDNDPAAVKVFGRVSAQQLPPGVACWSPPTAPWKACWSGPRKNLIGRDGLSRRKVIRHLSVTTIELDDSATFSAENNWVGSSAKGYPL